MSTNELIEKYKKRIQELEAKHSEFILEVEEAKILLEAEQNKRQYYQLIADFTFGWELWFGTRGDIKYCSPSCFDLTGFTANQIIASVGINDLLVYEADRTKYAAFVQMSLDQMIVNQTLEFRILTRTKQLRWCVMNNRSVYDLHGKYLGVRASIQDITKLKRAMGHIQELQASKDFNARSNQRLKVELEFKERELVAFLLKLSQKNELLSSISKLIHQVDLDNSGKNRKPLSKILELVNNNTSEPLQWSLVENQIEKLHPGFLARLHLKHPIISAKDKRLCSYLRLGLSSKEISGLQNITPKSVEIARVRLRKKLNLQSKIRLVNYLENM